MSKRIFTTLSVFALLFAVAVNAYAANDKKAVSGLTWNGDADKAVAANIDAVKNDSRKNASGPKITSNAHSADFPGIYFIWDSKQKDNGYLKVDAKKFENFGYFILTAKESNTYWDFIIDPERNAYGEITQLKTEDDCYVFYIQKACGNKNINMVFVGDAEYRTDDWIWITTEWVEECSCVCDCESTLLGKGGFWWKKGAEFGTDDDWDYAERTIDDLDYSGNIRVLDFDGDKYDADNMKLCGLAGATIQFISYCGCDDDGEDGDDQGEDGDDQGEDGDDQGGGDDNRGGTPNPNKGCENCEGNDPGQLCDGSGCAGNGTGAPGGGQGGGSKPGGGNQNQQ